MSARRVWPWLCCVALAAGCPEKASPARAGLKVSLPPGWVAEEGKSGALRAGPRGRTVLLLEHQGEGALPGPEAMEEKVKAEGGELLEVKRDDALAVVRYRVSVASARATAFIGARRLDGRLFLCASAPAASEAELALAEGVCRDLKWGGVQP